MIYSACVQVSHPWRPPLLPLTRWHLSRQSYRSNQWHRCVPTLMRAQTTGERWWKSRETRGGAAMSEHPSRRRLRERFANRIHEIFGISVTTMFREANQSMMICNKCRTKQDVTHRFKPESKFHTDTHRPTPSRTGAASSHCCVRQTGGAMRRPRVRAMRERGQRRSG